MLLLALLLPAFAAESTLSLSGEVPANEADHFLVPFEVPEGTVEIEVRHDDLSEANILDWGLQDPTGWRGWGGGNSEPAVVGVEAASRSYVPGPLPAGTWNVVVGKAKIAEEPASYAIEIVLRDVATLSPQTERAPYAPAVLETGARWYAGDFHVHSRESGDARPPLDENATFARGRGLDFIALSDHNTNTQLDFFADAQARHPQLLLVPSVEYTTYDGHANAVGAVDWVDHKIGVDVTIEAAVDAFHDQGAIFSINHPVLDIGSACIGCAWKHDLDPAKVDAVEIATGGWAQAGWLFGNKAIAFWDDLCAQGHHVAAIGGSDDHRAGVNESGFGSPIGDPTTMVWASELSTAAILQAIRDGRTVVKLQGPDDPMIELGTDRERVGDTVHGDATLTVTVTGGGAELVLFEDGAEVQRTAIDADPYVATVDVPAPEAGEVRWRAEVWVDGNPRTVTSHVWFAPALPGETGDVDTDVDDRRCGCATGGAGGLWVLLLGLLVRRRPCRRRKWYIPLR